MNDVQNRGQILSPWLEVDSGIGLLMVNVLYSTLESTKCEVIANYGIGAHPRHHVFLWIRPKGTVCRLYGVVAVTPLGHLFGLSRAHSINEWHFVERQKRRYTVRRPYTEFCCPDHMVPDHIPSLGWKMFSVWGPGINILSPRNFPAQLEFSSSVSLKIFKKCVYRQVSNLYFFCILL